MRKNLTAASILLICALICFSVTTYAWFTFTFLSSDNIFSTGKLQPDTEIQFWDKQSSAQNKWTDIGTGGTVQAVLGTVTDLANLPIDFEMFLKIKVNDNSAVTAYKWDTLVDDIEIKAFDNGDNTITPTTSINYFESDADNKQACFYFTKAIGTNNQNPASVAFGGEIFHLNTKGQSLCGAFIGSENWLYLYITVGTTELQNILRRIPINSAPYQVQFELTVTGEVRTIE